MVPTMVDEPDNLVLIQLREMRGQLQGISTKLEEHDRRFDGIDKRFDDFHLLVSHALGVSTANHLKTREFDARHEETAARQRRMEARFEEIEQRLGKVEEKSDT